jgi:sugar (pentulose or hexulose) kinase
MGERGPRPDPLASGALVGLTLRHHRGHVVRAVLEGTVYQIRRVLEARAATTYDGLEPHQKTSPTTRTSRDQGVAPSWANRQALPATRTRAPRAPDKAAAPAAGVTAGAVTSTPAQTDVAHRGTGIACGGAARSTLWMQVLADITGLTLRVPAAAECGALGAAILGGAAAGLFAVEAGQARMVHRGPTYRPEPAAVASYDARYRRYCHVDDLLAPWFAEGEGA